MTKNWKKITAGKNLLFYDQNLQFTYPKASINDVQAAGETFSPQEENIKHLLTYFNFCGSFLPSWIRIMIH
jgi:hypothetical protein